MKRLVMIYLIFATLTLPAYATTSGGAMEVRIWVIGGCNFASPADVVLDFGKLTGGNRMVSGSTAITCSSGTRFIISLDQGQNSLGGIRRLAQQGGNGRLPYTLTASPQIGISYGSRVDIRLEALINESDYRSLPLGQYQDIVVVKVEA